MEPFNEMQTEQQNREQNKSRYIWSANEDANWMKMHKVFSLKYSDNRII